MNVFGGFLLTGAVVSGIVIAERLRGRNTSEEVRADVSDVGTNVADHVGKAAGLVGRTGGRALSWSGDRTTDIGDATARVVSSTGHKVAEGTGAAFGAYAGLIDRVLPSDDRDDGPTEPAAESAPRAQKKRQAPRKAAARKAATRRSSRAPREKATA